MKRILYALISLCLFCITVSSCGKRDESGRFNSAADEGEIAYTFVDTDTYTNNLELPEQWGSNENTGTGEYGIGDPFVLRFDGKYYLYPSSDTTSDKSRAGVRVWQSNDLIHWEYKGYALKDSTADGAYAPEVIYYGGSFYMVQSGNGKGHYIYKSESPLGPFTRITDNFGFNIDGSFYVTDDDRLLLFYPENSVIKVTTLDNSTVLPTSSLSLNGTLNGWTEGPGIFRRNNFFYLTYTGNSVVSSGYRIGYSYLMGDDPSGNYVMPENNIAILETGPGNFKGLGHNSSTIGPDLDSVYTAYHNLIATAGPQRRLMIDRFATNGGYLYVNGPTLYQTSVPDRPDFEGRPSESADGFIETSSGILSTGKSENYFTAEFNFSLKEAGDGTVDCLIGYTNEKNYSAVEIDITAKTMTLFTVVKGEKKELGTAGIQPGGDFTQTSVIRVENGYNTTNIYYNSMRKIMVENAGIAGGRIGYGASGVAAAYSYTAFTNDVFGTSDFDAVKNVPTKFSAVHYLKGENRGFQIADVKVKKDGIRQGEKESTVYDEGDNQYALALGTSGDWVKYALNVSGESYYGLSATLNTKSAGAQFQVIVDSKDIYTFTVPKFKATDSDYANVKIAELPLTAGNHTIKIRIVSGNLTMKTLEFFQSNPVKIDYSKSLTELNDKGWEYIGNWKFTTGVMRSNPSDAVYAYTGAETLTDYSVQVDVALDEEDSMYDGGIIIREKNQSFASAQVAESYQGYYLAIRSDQITLSKYNYGSTILDIFNVDFQKGDWHTVKLEAKGNCIKIYVDDLNEPVITHYDNDAFLYGKIGLCSNNIGISYRNFSVKSIS